MSIKAPVNKYVFALLAIYFGCFGVHKLYQKKFKVAGAYFILSIIGLFPLVALISIVEGIHALFMRKDADNQVWIY